MCGIAGYLGTNKEAGLQFATRAGALLKHRGPDDSGIDNSEHVTLLHRRLSILDLSDCGHQPMHSSCGRYSIVFNGEIYNHQELRERYLSGHRFRSHSDTETIIELFRLMQEKMLAHMVGMWAIIVHDKQDDKVFISRDRYGQKPVYTRRLNGAWLIASEVKPLLQQGEQPQFDPTALTEYLALGNYGHLGVHTFYNDVRQFPQGCYAWVGSGDAALDTKKYWELPDVAPGDKVPFDVSAKKQLHDRVVEGVLSQTLADVPVGITLSGGVDSSIVAGILATYYDKEINIFTAQTPNSKYDESKYVDAVIAQFDKGNFRVHRKDLRKLSLKDDLEQYINIQEEPFGDPSIMAHGFLMQMAKEAGIKVILNGQGADELFFGYNNMAQAIMLKQMKAMQFGKVRDNLGAMKMGKSYMLRTLLRAMLPQTEARLRTASRIKRRDIIASGVLEGVNNDLVPVYSYNNLYNVWRESVYGMHIPHLVHYDDRNGMAYSIEGRMPFLDHRIAEYVATIKPEDFLMHGQRKYILREACRQYLPDVIYNRTDKIGFYTPLVDALTQDEQWVRQQMAGSKLLKDQHTEVLLAKLGNNQLDTASGLQLWRALSASIWMRLFNIG